MSGAIAPLEPPLTTTLDYVKDDSKTRAKSRSILTQQETLYPMSKGKVKHDLKPKARNAAFKGSNGERSAALVSQ